MTDDEKSYWRVYAALQELLRVTDEDIDANPDLRQLVHSFCQVVRLYRTRGPESIRVERHFKKLEEMGIPTIKPKPGPRK